MKIRACIITKLLYVVLSFTTVSVFGQGSLTPPGAPAPTMKTLSQVEPRTPISALPFTISSPGAYYVTTNIITTGANGLTIQANDVDLDLNGFALSGIPGSTSGIFINGTKTNVTVRNGTIRDWVGYAVAGSNLRGGRLIGLRVMNCGAGLDIGADSLVQDCVVLDTDTAANGIKAGANSRVLSCQVRKGYIGIDINGPGFVKDCLVSSNNNDGIQVDGPGSVENCQSIGNGHYGISTTSGLKIVGCQVAGSLLTGIYLGGPDCTVERTSVINGQSYGIYSLSPRSVVSQCNISSNVSTGIQLTGDAAAVTSCIVSSNHSGGIVLGVGGIARDCTVSGNYQTGITASGIACQIIGNTCLNNNALSNSAFAGIVVQNNNCRVEGNHLIANSYYGIYSSGTANNIIVRNTAVGNTASNYGIGGSNDIGPIGTAATATSPWANISH